MLGPELMFPKQNSETGRPATHHPANRDELERDTLLQQRRPLNPHFHFRAHRKLMPGSDQHTPAAHIHRFALARQRQPIKRAKADSCS